MKLNLILIGLLVLVGAASATIESFGSDPSTLYSEDEGATWNNAVAAWVHPNYGNYISIPESWIWRSYRVTETEAVEGSTVLFKRSFDIPECAVDPRGEIKITSDNYYDLSVNGLSVGSDGDWTTTETYDLTGKLLPGATNVFEFVAKNEAMTGGNMDSNPAALVYKATIMYEGCTDDEDPQVPEFGTIAALVAAFGGLGIMFASRRN